MGARFLASLPRLLAIWGPIGALVLGGAAAAGAAQYAASGVGRLVAVYPPWWQAERALAAASEAAPVAGVGRAGFMIGVVARSPDALRDLRRSGAWAVLDGRAFPACFANLKVSP